ncbi:MAG: pyruvate kinase, partial [Alistipes sp.]
MYREKKTKVVATLSDFRCTEDFVQKLYDAGMDVVRVNSAHASEEGATKIV